MQRMAARELGPGRYRTGPARCRVRHLVRFGGEPTGASKYAQLRALDAAEHGTKEATSGCLPRQGSAPVRRRGTAEVFARLWRGKCGSECRFGAVDSRYPDRYRRDHDGQPGSRQIDDRLAIRLERLHGRVRRSRVSATGDARREEQDAHGAHGRAAEIVKQRTHTAAERKFNDIGKAVEGGDGSQCRHA